MLPDTQQSPCQDMPKHVAIIMDGNGRWASARGLDNSQGHKAGVEPLREIIEISAEKGIRALTVFAFSSENWQRPEEEVSALMSLFVSSLTKEIDGLHEKGVQLRVIGKRDDFDEGLVKKIEYCENLSSKNVRLVLTLAVDYGGRWDIVNASQRFAKEVLAGNMDLEDLDEAGLASFLSNSDLDDPDLCIRTGGEHRISNFLLWQFAYTELYVTECLWPDFTKQDYLDALDDFVVRQRRFGKTVQQMEIS